MSDDKSDYLTHALKNWQEGRPLEAGRLIFEKLSPEVRPMWASNILAMLVKRTGIKSPLVENILQIARTPSEWNKTHEAFSAARALTLQLEKLGPKRPPEQTLLLSVLLLAELVAKVTYNGTNPTHEFDQDSGWWIAVNLKDVLDFLDDGAFSKSMWLALCSVSGP